MPKTKWGSVIFTAYKFFDSKELLFFVVLEDIHTEGFAVAQHSLQGNAALPRQSVRRLFWWPAGSCFNRGRLQRCGFSQGYRFAHSNQAFYPMVKFHYLPSHRKVRSWNVIVLFSHCPTPPDVFMILRKLPRHKDAIYYR